MTKGVISLALWLRWQRIYLQYRKPRFDPWVRKDSLKKGMATHSSILAWGIPWTEEHGRLYSPWSCKELDMTEGLKLSNCD